MTVDAMQLEKLDAREGDVFLMTTPGHVSDEEAFRLREQWERNFPGTKCIVLGDGIKLERIRTMPSMVAGDLGL